MIRQAMQTRARLRPGHDRQQGFTLIELMVVVAVIAILTIVAFASYAWSVTKTRRKEAAGCAEQDAQYMERFYASNLRYDQDLSVAHNPPALPAQCPADLTPYYTLGLTNLTATTYTINAVPVAGSIQAKNDTLCKTLSIDQTGKKTDSGTSSATPTNCW